MNGSNALGNAGPAFKEDIESDEFDNYIIFTYGLDTGLCSWFDDSDEVVICGPEDRTDEVSDLDVSASVSRRITQSHAKLYLMWGEERIVCWLGSFNFTYSGIYNNVEWAARFAGTLEHTPELTELLAGRVDSGVTDSWQVQQALELVSATFSGGDTTGADALLQNTTYPHVLVHSHRSNTLKRALQHELEAADKSVTLTYYSPFVNARGIELFLETLEPAIDRTAIHLIVRSCRLNNISGKDTGLSADHVARFKEELNGFEYQVRAPGAQGDQLRDGRDIRSGLAHHKTVGLSYIDHEGDEQRVTLLTTANLTKNAWKHHSGNFEIGLLLRDDERNDDLHELLGIQLSHCYERPRDPELDEAVSESAESASYEEVWVKDLLSERVHVSKDRIDVQWEKTLPSIDSLTATLYYRDILSGERSPETVALSETKEGFTSTIPSLTSIPNRVIDFVEIDIETRFRPPERRLTTAGLERLQTGELTLEEIGGETVVCDGTTQTFEAFDIDSQSPGDLWLRDMREATQPIKITYEPREHPHLATTFVQDLTTGVVTDSEYGGFVYLEANVDEAITPRPEQLLLHRPNGDRVEYLGYTYPDSTAIRYYFDAVLGDTEIHITPAPPLDRYYAAETRATRLPSISTSTAESVQAFVQSSLSALPASGDSYIDEETPIALGGDPEVIPGDAPIQVHWGLRGYDRFGGTLPIDEILEPQEAHRQVWFRGSVDLSLGETTVTLLSRRNSTTVYAQPFTQALSPRKDLLPDYLDLQSVSKRELLVWLVFDREDLLKPAVRDTEKHLKVTLSEERNEYQKPICPVLDDGELLCIPLMGHHRDTTLELDFELELQGGRPEVCYYAPRSLCFELHVDANSSSVTLDWGDESHVITHRAAAGRATLNMLADRVDRNGLYELLNPTDPFDLRDSDGLALAVRKPGLLHLYGQQSTTGGYR